MRSKRLPPGGDGKQGKPMGSYFKPSCLKDKNFLAISSCIFVVFLLVLPAQNSWELSDGMSANTVLGQASFLTKFHGTASSALDSPSGSVFDSQGNLWVADTQNNRVLEFQSPLTTNEAASVIIGQVSQGPGPGHHDDDQSNSTLNSPSGVAFDSQGNLWGADTQNNRVLEFQSPLTTNEAASVILGQGGTSGDEGHDDEGHDV